jgi:transposase InsO family protein
MEKLPTEQQKEITKLSTERLVAKLVRAGVNEELVDKMDRQQLLQAWAQCVADGVDKPGAAKPPEGETGGVSAASLEMQRMMFEFEKWKFEQEMKYREDERVRREKEQEERRQLEEEERIRQAEREENEKKRQDEREAKDRELRQRELKVREAELKRLAKRDEDDAARRESLASRSKFFGEVLKNIVWKFPHDAADIPVFFDHIENLFEVYEVPDELKARILQAQLSDKAKSLTARLSREQSADYDQLKTFLLNEFKLSPQQYRQRFLSASKLPDETYALFASRLKNMFMYYLQSRKIKDEFEKLVSLMVADRVKGVLPEHCLKYILAQEGETWLGFDKLAQAVDVYMSSHFADGRPRGFGGPQGTERGNPTGAPPPLTPRSTGGKPETVVRAGPECYECHSRFHKVKDCPQRKAKMGNKPSRVNACAVIPPITCHTQCQTDDLGGGLELIAHPKFISEGPASRSNLVGTADKRDIGQATVSNIVKSVTPHIQPPDQQSCNEPGCSCIEAKVFHDRTYVDVDIENVAARKALLDGGAEVCCIDANLVKHLNLPVVKQIRLTGLSGAGDRADVIRLHVRPAQDCINVNIAPPIHVWFAVINGLNEECGVILTPSVVDLLNEAAHYTVLAAGPISEVRGAGDDPTDAAVHDLPATQTTVEGGPGGDAVEAAAGEGTDFLDVETLPMENKNVADTDVLRNEQLACPTLEDCWEKAKRQKAGFYVENGLLCHRENLLGHKVKQLVLPECRRKVVLEMGHDAAFAGHLSCRRTQQRIRLSFWFPRMDQIVRDYCTTCHICQLRAPLRTVDRVPISPIPRGDELPFTHLVMDCIGPIISDTDAVVGRPRYNYALVICDQFTRWPMAYPLRNMSAKAVCEALLQVFMTFSIPKVISSDCGSNFTSSLTREFLARLGVSPVFNTPGHPEASGVVERCNATLKAMIAKLVHQEPQGWWNLLPFVLWALREVPNETTGVAPFTLLYGTLPRGPLSALKESWAGTKELPLNLGKGPVEYLQSLKENLELAKVYAEAHASKELQRHAAHYNLRSTEKRFEVGDRVVILAPDSSNKVYSRWQGPGTISKVKSPHSYIVELDGKLRHLHANKLRRYRERLEQARVDNCAIIFDKDSEFGTVEVVGGGEPDDPGGDHSELLPSQRLEPDQLSHLSEDEKRQLCVVLDKFHNVFRDKPGFCSLVEHEIVMTPDFKPKRLKAYKVPEILKPEVNRQINELLEMGFIYPSKSEMASPVVCVLKGKDGSKGVRLAVDYRYINKYSLGDAYPTPDVSDVLQRVGRAKYISTFDAKAGYWQISVKPESRWLTAFVCDAGLFEFARMPFGLKTAGNTFLRAAQQVLSPIREFTDSFVDEGGLLQLFGLSRNLDLGSLVTALWYFLTTIPFRF